MTVIRHACVQDGEEKPGRGHPSHPEEVPEAKPVEDELNEDNFEDNSADSDVADFEATSGLWVEEKIQDLKELWQLPMNGEGSWQCLRVI